ncbi:MAG: MCE family protein [Microscillaceae bacterium]|nr:MCE family protein [Microscillaceae bacterium]
MSKEFRIGLLALVASVMLYAGFNFLKGTDFLSRTNAYYVVYEQIDGLTISNPVQFNGLNVGRVSNIEILQNQNNKLLLTLEIRKDLVLGQNSLALLTDNGLLGGKMIDLQIGKIGKALQNGDTLKSRRNAGLVAELSQKADPLVKKADSILYQVNEVLKALANSKQDLQETMANFNAITASMRNTLAQGQIDGMLRNMNQLSASLVVLEKDFHPIVGKMDAFAGKLNQLELAAALQSTQASLQNLNQILQKVNQGEGTLGKLANDDSLYTNMNRVSEDLDKLFIDLRENPKRYINLSVFGRKSEQN